MIDRSQLRPAKSIFFSTAQNAPEMTNAYITTTDPLAYAKAGGEMELLGQAAATMGAQSTSASPYSTRLRPVTSMGRLLSAKYVELVKVTFRALDTTLAGGSGQDGGTVGAMTDSLTTTINDAYVQSRFINSEIGHFQPNWFRPQLYADGADLFLLSGTGFDDGLNQGDLSIGLPLPYCWEPFEPINIQHVDSIRIYAGAGQYVRETGLIQRFPIHCLLEWLVL